MLYTIIKMVVYCIKHNEQVLYVGSTKQFSRRLNQYRQAMKNPEKHTPIIKYLVEHGFENMSFQFVDDHDNLLSDIDRLKLEGEYIKKLCPVLNVYKNPVRTEKKSYYTKIWADNNKEKVAAYKKKSFAKWYEKNADIRNKKKRDNRVFIKWLKEFDSI